MTKDLLLGDVKQETKKADPSLSLRMTKDKTLRMTKEKTLRMTGEESAQGQIGGNTGNTGSPE